MRKRHVGKETFSNQHQNLRADLVWMLLQMLVRFLELLELVEQEGLVFPLLMRDGRRDEKGGQTFTENADEALTLMICCRS